MKYLVFVFLLSACSLNSTAQQNGVILFEEKIHFALKDSTLPQGLSALLPKEIPSHFRLYYSPEATLYEPDDSLNNLQSESGNDFGRNVNVSIHINQPGERYYLDIQQHRLIHQTELMGRLFLIPDEEASYKWKLTGKQKKILGFVCNEAVLTNDSLQFRAWFTSNIPVSSGPERFYGLPGMILELSLGKGLHIEAKEIRAASPEDTRKIIPPEKGKKISRKAFLALKARKTKELKEHYGNRDIIIQTQ